VPTASSGGLRLLIFVPQVADCLLRE
jgi:hypothetical protein